MQYHIYLFEKLLMICAEVLPTKAARNLQLLRLRSARVKEKSKLVFKGRVFGTNITDVRATSNPGEFSDLHLPRRSECWRILTF